MDETTAALLARFQRQMGKADRLFDRADLNRALADRVENGTKLPEHLRQMSSETERRLEARQLRLEAEALQRRAAEMQRALYQSPPEALSKQIDDWIAGRNPGRERDGHER